MQVDRQIALSEILSNDQFASYLNLSIDGGPQREIYYAIMMPLASSIKVLIDPSISVGGSSDQFTISANQTKPEDYYIYFVVPLSIFTIIMLIQYIYVEFVWIYKSFWRTTLLLPAELILKNPLLTKELRQVETSTKSRIAFY